MTGPQRPLVMQSPHLDGRRNRLKRIRQAAKQPLGQHWVTLKQGPQQIPILELDQNLLLYRADNGRLLAELGQRFAGQQGRIKALKQSEESTDTQELLHELLIAKAADARGPILEELRRLAVQTEPLLADATGVVINGNRRLSAMRLLLTEDESRYSRFLRPQVAVLPKGVTREDLEYLETALQLAPETKLPYGWVERRLKLRHQTRELGLDAAWVQEAYRLGSEQQLNKELAELDLVETYLTHWHGTSCEYPVVAKSEPLFEGLCAQLDGLKGPTKTVWTTIGLLLIHQRQQLPAAVDGLYPFAAPAGDSLPPQVLQQLAAELALVETAGQKPLKKTTLRSLQNVILNTQDRRAMATRIQGLIEELQEQHQKDRIPGRILKNLQQSNRLMEKLQAEALSERERAQLLGEAAAIKSRLDLLVGNSPAENRVPLQRRWRLRRWLLKRLGRA